MTPPPIRVQPRAPPCALAARPPSYDRGNAFFMTIPTQKAGQMWGFGGDNHAHGAAESRPWSLTGRFRFQGSQRRFLALSGKRAFGAVNAVCTPGSLFLFIHHSI